MSTVTTIGDRVKLKTNNLVGVVRFIGSLKHKNGIFYGIELDEKKGTNDGSIGNIYYFKTEKKKGVFIKKSNIMKTNAKYNPYVPRVTVNDTIYITKYQCTGIIRYIGSPEFISKKRSKSFANTKKSSERSLASNSRSDWSETSNSTNYKSKFAIFALNNIWYGIELTKPFGKNNGIVQGKWYFNCKPTYGLFIRKEQIELMSDENENKNQSECIPLKLDRNRSKSLEFDININININKKNKLKRKRKRKQKPNGSDISNISESKSTEIIYDNNNNNNNENIKKKITIGDTVKLNDGLQGNILFIGPILNKKGIFYGIELDKIYSSKGKNDGSFRGKYYFKTLSGVKSGLFIKEERINEIFIGNNKRKRIGINDKVFIDKFDCIGTIRFIGNTEFKKGIWYGIELEKQNGKNNGTVNGIYYFKCNDGYGTFLKQKSINIFNDNNNNNNNNININDNISVTSSITSSIDLLGTSSIDLKYNNTFIDILMTENDLAGFCFAWIIGMIYVIILRLRGDEHVVNTQWYSILSIPIIIILFTWLFSYYITKYTKEMSRQKETMSVPSFFIPFFCKVFVSMIFFGRLMKDIKQRTDNSKEFGIICNGSLIVMWFHCVLSVITSEIMITTVMVNSITNLDQLRIINDENKWYINIFLFITRPVLWVYNRLIVMFISFYLYYYLIFGIGPACLYICTIQNVTLLSDIGIYTLLLPFHNVLYLFEFDKWTNFQLSKYNTTTQTIFAVIQQVLIFTTIFDLLMDFWSIYVIINRNNIHKLQINPKKEKELPPIIQLPPKKPQHLSVIPESQTKSRNY